MFAAPSLTAQQEAALQARDRSVSLAAGAGCGKTFVLTERFILHVDPTQADSLELDELVAITFTDAAAREMRDRIRRRCYDRLQAAQSPAEAAAWQRLMRSMDRARISTIHSFCGNLLRTFAVEAGIDPQFEVLDPAAAQLLKLETVDDRLRSLLIDRNPETLELAAKRGLDALRVEIARLAGPLSAEVVAKWRDATPEELVAHWREFFSEKLARSAAQELTQSLPFRRLRELARGSSACSAKLIAHLAVLDDSLAGLADRGTAQSLDALRELAKVQGVCTKKDWQDAADYDAFRDACKALRDAIDKSILKKPIDPAAALEAATQGLQLLRLVGDVSNEIEVAKARRHQLEFDDLLARTHRLLTSPEHEHVRRRIGESARLVMVDEFQDTNPLQMAIIVAVAGSDWRERGLFAVGDFKQSIYRFNGAQPHVSENLRAALPDAGRLSLTTNFRSQPAITDFVNAVFFDAFAGYEPLLPNRPQLTPTPAVEFLWTIDPSAGEDDEAAAADHPPSQGGNRGGSSRRKAGDAHRARVREAHVIAARLRELLASEEKIIVDDMRGDAKPRRLRPGDVAILLRTLSDAPIYEEALRDAGLEYYLAGGHAFYSQQEVYDLLNLFRAVASAADEVALAGALRSPLFSLADETLFWMVQVHGSLNAALAANEAGSVSNRTAPPNEFAKITRAAATLRRLRAEKDRLLVADLFTLALELTGFDAVLLTEFLGQRKAANVEKLIEQARTLDQTAPGDLHGFITQLSEFVIRAPKEALAATQAEGDVIRIMTYHYAKGLEFPLVVLPDLDRPRHLGRSEAVFDLELGPLVPIDREQRTGSIGLDLYRHVEKVEDLEERKRLFYVACTRAADYLILSSSMQDPDAPKQDWLQLVDGRVSLVDGTLRTPLPIGYSAPAIHVSFTRPDEQAALQDRPRGADLHGLVEKTRALAAKGPAALPALAAAIPVDAAARRRFSFSRLTGHLTLDPIAIEQEPFAPPEASTSHDAAAVPDAAAELGTLVHAVLQRLDFRQPHAVRELCDALAPGLITDDPDRATVDAMAILERFLASPRAAELAAAQVIRREVELLLAWPPEANVATGRYLHGFIDCLYQTPAGRWRLIDYKTNRVAADRVSQTVARYEPQLLVYSLACERALGEPLESCTLALLHPGVEHAYTWDAAAISRGVANIDDGIQALIDSEHAIR